MKNNYKPSTYALKSDDSSNMEKPRVLARLLSREATGKVSGGHEKGDVVCTGTQKADRVQVDCTYY